MASSRWQGFTLLALALSVALFGSALHLTPAARTIVALILALFGAVLVARTGGLKLPALRLSGPFFPSPLPPLKPGEKYDTTVKLATLPNVPLADLWCQRLREHGIEAFYKGGMPLAGTFGEALDAALPAELWVGEHDAERAAQLMRELG